MRLPLAFAYLLAGGLFMVSAVENIPMTELVKHGLQGAKAPTASNRANSALVTETGGGGGGGVGSGTPAHPLPTTGPKASAPAKGANEYIFKEYQKKLETYLKRPLTAKEKKELHQAQAEGQLEPAPAKETTRIEF